MAKFPTYEEMGKKVAEIALDEFLYDGKSIREWMQIIASEDAISRQAVLDATVKKNSVWNSITNSKGENLEEIISQLPPVTPQPKMGHWIFVDEAKEHARCSKCNSGIVDLFDGKLHNYCEVCGAKMEYKECI